LKYDEPPIVTMKIPEKRLNANWKRNIAVFDT
jgi:hypothetical protein